MGKVELQIIALAESESSPGNYALILEEQVGGRRLPILVGSYEAQAIAISLERMQPSRPLTHDLFKSTLELLGAKLTEVVISNLVNGVFHATLVGKKEDHTHFMIDARSSDAIALALRFDCPIFTTEAILEKAGFLLDSPSKSFISKRGSLSDYSLEELEHLLKQVVAKEDYESAAKIREAIRKKMGERGSHP